MTYTVDQLRRIGGIPWRKSDGTLRMYLNAWEPMVGLEIHRYNTGNIQGATLEGVGWLSNRKAGMLTAAKVYLEAETGEIRTDLDRVMDSLRLDITGAVLVERLHAEIERRVRALEPMDA